MIVASWNVNSLAVRMPQLALWIQEHRPNVICLQETKLVDEKFPKAAFDELGYTYEFYGEKTYNGVAIISDRPIMNVKKGFIEEQEPNSKRFIEAMIDDTYILNVYIPNGQKVGSDKYEYKLRWIDSLRTHLDKEHKSDTKLLLCGDFNIAPDDRDVYNPGEVEGTIMVSDLEREQLAFVQDWGFIDAYRMHHEEGGQFSWWDYRMGAFRRDMGFRIDHIWLTEALANNCVDSWIDKSPRMQERPSDHAPILVELS